MPISNADLQKLEDDGYVLIRSVFDKRTVEAWARGWEMLKAAAKSGSAARNDRFFYGVLPAPLGLIYRAPQLVEIIKRLIGEDVALYFNRMLAKDEAWNGPVVAHQDMPYFHGTNKLSVFIPIKPFNLETGGLSFVKGSHKFGIQGRGSIDVESFAGLQSETPDAQPGDIILMDFMTWHYSEPARISTDRPVMQLAYQIATDGSYFGEQLGVAEPTLVCGEWRTNRFIRFQQGLTLDAGPVTAATVATGAPRAFALLDTLDIAKFEVQPDWKDAQVSSGTTTSIVTVASQWGYSAALPVHGLDSPPDHVGCSINLEIQVREGSVGVSLLSSGELKYEQFVSHKHGRTAIFLPVESGMEYVMVRNARPGGGQSVVTVLAANIVRSDIDISRPN